MHSLQPVRPINSGLTGLELQTLLAEKGIELPIIVVSGVVE
jgi:FixJ family two-component response regulator